MNERKFVGTWLEQEEHEKLRRLAKQHDRSLAAEVRMAIRQRFTAYPYTQPKREK